MFRILALTLLIVTSAYAEESSETRKAPSTAEEVDTLFGEFWNAGDLEALVSLYEADAVLYGPDGAPVTGHDAIRSTLGAYGVGGPEIEMKVISVARTSDGIALLFNHWTLRGENEDGAPFEVSGRAMEVVRQQEDGSWRFILDHPTAGGTGWTEAAKTEE